MTPYTSIPAGGTFSPGVEKFVLTADWGSRMRLYGEIQKIEPQDDGTVRVHGIATSEAVDEQGEIVRAEAIRAALPDYMRFPALREMHQLSAAGTTLEAEVHEDGTTRIVAHVVDPVAVAKVKNQVYRGFSIGGRVTQRDPGNPKAITSLVLNEISLVDRPANPEAIYDCWKATHGSQDLTTGAGPSMAARGQAASMDATTIKKPFNAPVQVWACGVPDHRHLTKADALKCLEKRASKPMAGQTIEAPTERGNPARVALIKELRDISRFGRVIADLDWLKDALDLHTTAQNDQSPQQGRLHAIITELCGFLSELLAEEAGEVPSDESMDSFPLASRMPGMLVMAAGASGIARIAAYLRKGTPNMRKLADSILVKAEHAQSDQMLLDIAHLACRECLKVGGLSADEEKHIAIARDRLRQASAAPLDLAGDDPVAEAKREMLSMIAALLGKGQPAHRMMMDLAHECVSTLSDRAVCGQAAKVRARPSANVMKHLQTAHGHLVAAGAGCEESGPETTEALPEDAQQGNEFEPGYSAGNLAQGHAAERAEKTALAKALSEIVPMLERLSKRVDEIARTPLPPLTIAKGTVSVSKQQDRGGISGGDPELSQSAVASAFAKMSKEEQTLTLIKASYANPIKVAGSAPSER